MTRALRRTANELLSRRMYFEPRVTQTGGRTQAQVIKMKSLRLQNIRSLSDTGAIELKPITILLGQNSSGKSTFLRTFPLLRQSLRTRSNAPVLWYGDLVDFGSIKEVKSTFSGEHDIRLELAISRDDIIDFGGYTPETILSGYREIRLAISLCERDEETRLSSLTLTFGADSIEIEVGPKNNIINVSANNIPFTTLFDERTVRLITSEFVPQFISVDEVSALRTSLPWRSRRGLTIISKEIRRFFRQRLHGNVSEGTVTRMSQAFSYTTETEFVRQLQKQPWPYASWRTFLDNIISKNGRPQLTYLRMLYLINELPQVLQILDRNMYYFLNNTSYVGPSRATGERYYRLQELAVDQIDPQGKNLAMFLNSLSIQQQISFSSWLGKHLGHHIKVDRSAGHIRILLKQDDSQDFHNITDMGYGFSQVLPIMAQIWSNTSRRRSGRSYVVMEQPELHLHPAYQAKIADTLIGALESAKEMYRDEVNQPITFVIETHSEALVNRIGEMIYNKRLNTNDVAIYIFEKGIDQEKTTVRTSMFSTEGTLMNWPYAFFSSSL